MTAIIQNITIEQGADYLRSFCIIDENGDPVDITGAIAAMQMSTGFGFPPVLTLTTANGGLVIDGPNGRITPVITAAMTTVLYPGMYVYDINMVLTSGRTIRPFQGTATVSQEVTIIVPPYPAPSPSPSPAPSPDAYTTEDGTTVLTGEDGTTILTQES